jgi:hypothetical protein
MKITKFGTITEKDGRIITSGFEGYSEPGDEAPEVEIIKALIKEFSKFVPLPKISSGSIQDTLVSLYRYTALPHTVTPGGPIFGVIKEVFESVVNNTRIIIETSNGGAKLRAEAIAPPVAAGSVDTPEFEEIAKECRKTGDEYTRLLAHINAWGAQQREAGRMAAWCEGVNADGLREENAELRQRAEKAEARVKELEAEDLAMHRKLAAEKLRADQGWERYEAANRAKNDLEREKVAPSCDCHSCQPITMENNRMILCATCGNKRCPQANDHRNACTGSNEPGQAGSAYTAIQMLDDALNQYGL